MVVATQKTLASREKPLQLDLFVEIRFCVSAKSRYDWKGKLQTENQVVNQNISRAPGWACSHMQKQAFL